MRDESQPRRYRDYRYRDIRRVVHGYVDRPEPKWDYERAQREAFEALSWKCAGIAAVCFAAVVVASWAGLL